MESLQFTEFSLDGRVFLNFRVRLTLEKSFLVEKNT